MANSAPHTCPSATQVISGTYRSELWTCTVYKCKSGLLRTHNFKCTEWTHAVTSAVEECCQALGANKALQVEARLSQLICTQAGACSTLSTVGKGAFATLDILLPSAYKVGIYYGATVLC